ncbi:MAG: tetratricopeptide repeat protein [Alphaproteobacteria bacterium]
MLQFTHALIRDSLYSSILHAERRALHGRAATWFAGRDASLHAEHLARAEDPAAVDAFVAAAQALARDYRLEAALDRIRRAAGIAATASQRCRLAIEEGALLLELGTPGAAVEAYDRAIEIAPDPHALAAAQLGMAAVLRLIERVDESLPLLDAAQPALEEAGDHRAMARLEHLRGNLLFPRGRPVECRQAHERALAHARACADAELEARALGGLGDAAYATGHFTRSRDHFAACIAAARDAGIGRVDVANRPMLAIIHAIAGEPDRAMAEATAAIAAATAARQPRAEIIAHHIAMMVHLWCLRPDRVAAHFDRAEALATQLGARRFKAENLTFMGEACRLSGDNSRALALLGEAVAITRETGTDYVGAMVLGYQALAAHGRPEIRDPALAEGQALIKPGSIAHNPIFFGIAAIEAMLLAGLWPRARLYADGMEAAFAEEPVPLIAFLARRGRLLADLGERPGDPGLRGELADCLAEGRRFGYAAFLQALEAATD